MWFMVFLIICISVFVFKNEKISDNYRTGWGVVAGVFVVGWLLISIVL